MLDRRVVVGGLMALGAAGCHRATAPQDVAASPDLAAIATKTGGRLGVAALDTGSGRRLGHDPDSRYALCSTFKMPLAAAVLARVDTGALALDDRLPFTDADLLEHAPAVREHLAERAIAVGDACAGAVERSDNSAANLLLRRIGGPEALTHFMRAAGDPVSRLDRYETALNLVGPGEVHDTTTPTAMIGLMHALLLGNVLTPPSRAQLIAWLVAGQTGGALLRAGLPPAWRVGDKTGRSGEGAVNDIAIAWPPGRAPILIASYLYAPKLSADQANAVHADVARVVAAVLA
ncbi:class A beta-lactamase [Hephaestia sp. GCM10023244]|uniref:class A beta-lactamase n=1 Tax=unclassified Hephaestia TaxID=2631281 RepID=UPI002076E1C3|nr:class A beta-lactamase [Hephaestia sp. MAHUQ-44]MCM8730090.1 class A beta-lactamase [Hephaestia sp. MAHUQ-44]